MDSPPHPGPPGDADPVGDTRDTGDTGLPPPLPPPLPPGVADRLAALLAQEASRDAVAPPEATQAVASALARAAHHRAEAADLVRARLAAEPSPVLPDDVADRVAAALDAAAAERGAEPRRLDDLAVRRLRSALAADEPGPLPADVEDRILAALAAERTPTGGRATPQVAPVPVAPRARRRHLPFAHRERPRPRWALALGAAAAVAAVAVLGTAVVRAVHGPSSPGDGLAAVTVGSSEHAYDAADLGEQARRLVGTAGTGGVTDDPSAGPLATRAGLDSCLRGLGLQDATAVAVDLASYDGRPAAVLVVTRDGRTSAWVVGRGCSADAPGVVRSDVPVP